jgi:hypothetical protein
MKREMDYHKKDQLFIKWEKVWLLDRRRSTFNADWSGGGREHWLEGGSANVHQQYIFQDGCQVVERLSKCMKNTYWLIPERSSL